MDPEDLEDENAVNWRKKWQITILVKDYFEKWSRNRWFKITEDNELKIDLKHLVYYILLWIVCVDNLCNIYLVLKKKQQRYLIRMY